MNPPNLDDPPGVPWSRVVRLTVTALQVPLALIARIDRGQLVLMQAAGDPMLRGEQPLLPLVETFCRQVIATGAPLILSELPRAHGASASHAIGDSPIGAYFGIPLIAADSRVCGVYCVGDVAPRAWTSSDRVMLTDLAGLAQREMTRLLSHKQAELTGPRVAERIAAILGSTLAPVITIDHLGRIQTFNRAAEHLFGYSHDQAIGQNVADLIVPPHLREAHRRTLLHCMAKGEGGVLGRRIELIAMHAHGYTFPVELVVTSIAMGDEQPLFIGYIHDLRGREHLEILQEAWDRQAALRADVNAALATHRSLPQQLQQCAETVVRHLGLSVYGLSIMGRRCWAGIPPRLVAVFPWKKTCLISP